MSTGQRYLYGVDPELDVKKKREIVDPGPYEGIIKNNVTRYEVEELKYIFQHLAALKTQ